MNNEEMKQLFWNSYKRLEREVLDVSEDIYFCDEQTSVYSPRIGDLLVRTVIEIESLSKALFQENGGSVPADRDLRFDTDCLRYLEEKWLLSEKKIFIIAQSFAFFKDENKVLTPLNKASRCGKGASKWQKAYQALKHDRINNLRQGSVGNLLSALGALYILNIYYRNASYETAEDRLATKIDWSLGSELFSVKVCYGNGGPLRDQVFVKSSDYNECIYLVKCTDDTAQTFSELMFVFERDVNEMIKTETIQAVQAGISSGEIKLDIDTLQEQIKQLRNTIDHEVFQRVLNRDGSAIRKAVTDLRYEAVINTQQF